MLQLMQKYSDRFHVRILLAGQIDKVQQCLVVHSGHLRSQEQDTVLKMYPRICFIHVS